MRTREKRIIHELLDRYKNMPFLWDKKHKYYRNQKCRNEGYRALLDVYKELDEDATKQVVIKKIQNLRTNYIKELKKVRKCHQADDGAGPAAAYVPTLWYFNTFRFLGKHLKNEIGELRDISAVDPLDAEDVSSSSPSDAESDHPEELLKSSILSEKKIKTKDVSSSSLFDAESYQPKAIPTASMSSLKKRRTKKASTPKDNMRIKDVPSSSPSDAESDRPIPKASRTSSVPSQKNRRPTKASTLQRQHNNSTTSTTGNEPKMADRECEILGRSIGLQLRDLSKKQRTITQKIISDAIFYANMGLLTENSFVGLQPPNTETFSQPSPSSSTHFNKGNERDHKSLPHKQSPQSASSSPSYIVITARSPSPLPAEYLQSPQRHPSPQYIYTPRESPPPSHI